MTTAPTPRSRSSTSRPDRHRSSAIGSAPLTGIGVRPERRGDCSPSPAARARRRGDPSSRPGRARATVASPRPPAPRAARGWRVVWSLRRRGTGRRLPPSALSTASSSGSIMLIGERLQCEMWSGAPERWATSIISSIASSSSRLRSARAERSARRTRPRPRRPRRAHPCPRTRPGSRRDRTRAARARLEAGPHLRRIPEAWARNALAADDEVSNRAVADRGHERQGRPRCLDRVLVLRKARPRPLGGPTPSSARRYARRSPAASERSRPEPIRTDHLRRPHALGGTSAQQWIVVRPQRRVHSARRWKPGQSQRPSASSTSPDKLLPPTAAIFPSAMPTSADPRRPVPGIHRCAADHLHHKDRREPAVDDQELAVDEVRRGRGEEDDRAGELVRLAPASRRHARAQPGIELRVLLERLVQVCAEVPRRDPVRLDPVRRPLGAHRARRRQHLQPALRRRVSPRRRPCQFAHHRADVDDLAAAALDHARRDRPSDEEGTRQV